MKRSELFDKFSKEVSLDLNISEDTIYEVIRHQWMSAHKALNREASVEISGLGKFTIRPKQIEKRIKLLNAYINAYNKKLELLPNGDSKAISLYKKINSAQEEIYFLQRKLNSNV